MAMITQTRPADATPKEALPPEPVRGLGGLFGWIAVAVAVIAATVLIVRAFSSEDAAAPRPWYSVEHGSITAIDHTAAMAGSIAEVSAERGSIAAIDHAAMPSAARQWYSIEHGSVTAIDHATATAGSMAEVSAERGSIAAIDHAATPSAARQWYSVEHGGISAIDHATAIAER